MELLTPLLTYTYEHTLTRKDVMKLGMDMCRALELVPEVQHRAPGHQTGKHFLSRSWATSN
jgi:hypothetical protein